MKSFHFLRRKQFKNELSPPFDVKQRKRKTEVDIGQRIAELEDDARQEIPYIVNQSTYKRRIESSRKSQQA